MKTDTETLTVPPRKKLVQYEDHEGMPSQVATEMLCAPRAKLTNQMRKTCHAARVWVVKHLPKPTSLEDKLAAKLTKATLVQLIKWHRRSTFKRRGVQYAYCKIAGDSALADAMRARLAAEAEALDTFRDCITVELTRRETARAAKYGADIIPLLS